MLLLYFIGFHLLEPILPSLLTRFAGSERRGIAVGVYNTVQFIGAFLDGILGGIFLKYGINYMIVFNAFVSLIWLIFIFNWLRKVEIVRREKEVQP